MMFNKTNKVKIRLLPVFIFVAVLTVSVKLNNIFDLYNNPAQKTLSISPAQALAEEKANSDTAELSKVLNQGDKAAANAAAGTPASAFTQSEILILQELAERREALDIRAKEIDKRAIQLKVAEDEIDKKIKQLKAYEQKLQKLINKYSEQEQENIASLVKLYTSMKPKDAARIFNTLDMNITVALLKGMKPSSSSAILSQMNSEKSQGRYVRAYWKQHLILTLRNKHCRAVTFT